MNPLAEDLKRDVEQDITTCGLCKKCLFLCPLPESKDIDVFTLNREVSKDQPSKEILDFAFLCMSCGQCNYSCPNYQHMVNRLIYLRSKGRIPRGLKPLLHWRGQRLGVVDRALYGLKKRLASVHPRIAPHIDKKEYRKSDLLFYFSCYAFSPSEVPWKTLAIADHLGLDYEVVAGYSSCCGWPHYLAGDFTSAEQLFKDLAALIEETGAKTVVTGCAECYRALELIKNRYGGGYTPLTTTEWVLGHMDRLNLQGSDELVTFHDACNLSRYDGKQEAPRKVVKRLFRLVEMERTGKDTLCCGAMRQNHEKEGLMELRKKRLAEAKETGATAMVTECITCYEVYRPLAEGIKVMDLVEALYDSIAKEG